MAPAKPEWQIKGEGVLRIPSGQGGLAGNYPEPPIFVISPLWMYFSNKSIHTCALIHMFIKTPIYLHLRLLSSRVSCVIYQAAVHKGTWCKLWRDVQTSDTREIHTKYFIKEVLPCINRDLNNQNPNRAKPYHDLKCIKFELCISCPRLECYNFSLFTSICTRTHKHFFLRVCIHKIVEICLMNVYTCNLEQFFFLLLGSSTMAIRSMSLGSLFP